MAIQKQIRVTCDTADSVPLEKIIPFQGGFKTLAPAEFEKLKNSLIKYGLSFPSFIWKQNGHLNCLDGHQRTTVLSKMKEDGWKIPAVPVVYIRAANEKEAKEKVLLLTSQYGHYTQESLFEFVKAADLDWGSLEGLMDLPQLDMDFLAESPTVQEGPEPQFDKAEELRTKYDTKLGQVWQLGDHRLMCADASEKKNQDLLMNANIDLVLTDPPYGLGVDAEMHKNSGRKYGNMKGHKGHYAATDWDHKMSAGTINLVRGWARHQIIWGGNYYSDILPVARCWLVWDKENGENEFGDCEVAWTSLDKPIRIKKHLWNGMLRKDRESRHRHPTQKPVGVIAWAMLQVDNVQTIFDPFLGSGTTLIACEQLQRRCFGMEISPQYTAVAIQRWVDLTKKTPQLLRA
jgi:DNA modification methylase